MATLDEKQAFEAMRHFLEAHWERSGKASDDLAGLLGDLNRELWSDEGTADPALWSDWLDAVGRVTDQ